MKEGKERMMLAKVGGAVEQRSNNDADTAEACSKYRPYCRLGGAVSPSPYWPLTPLTQHLTILFDASFTSEYLT